MNACMVIAHTVKSMSRWEGQTDEQIRDRIAELSGLLICFIDEGKLEGMDRDDLILLDDLLTSMLGDYITEHHRLPFSVGEAENKNGKSPEEKNKGGNKNGR